MLLEKIIKNMNSDQKAYKNDAGEYTYKELFARVKQIYFYLKSKSNCKRVVFIGNKEVDMVAGFLASSIAGKTYIPIDAFMPKDRVDRIIEDSKPQIIITMEEKDIFSSEIEQINVKNICYSTSVDNNFSISMKQDDIYYIIYTSGSTGEPKGVQITYSNLEAFVTWLVDGLGEKKTVVLNQASYSFDLSVADIYYAFFTGSELVATDVKRNYNDMLNYIVNSRAEMAVFTPSFAELLLLDNRFCEKEMNTLKTIFFCGEKLRPNIVKKLKERFSCVKIINSYGPTEATVAICMIEITDDMLLENELPIGTQREDIIKIVDKHNDCVEDGQVGEIAILGETVSPGYLGQSSKSFTNIAGTCAYSTGDIGYIKQGKVYFCGRKDNQIKYNGYRIELEDITNNLLKLDYIDNAVTICKKKEDKVVNIISFVKLKKHSDRFTQQIKLDLSCKIPKYMLPRIRVVSQFELNKNGKIDVKKLEEKANV